VAGRVHAWRLAGNSIVPQAHAEAIKAFMETVGLPPVYDPSTEYEGVLS
jgi:hypothetical protein